MKVPWASSPSSVAWARSCSSCVPAPATRKRTSPSSSITLGQRLERDLEALLVDEPADQQHELLVRRGEALAQPAHLLVVPRLEVGGVDPVRDHGDALLLDRVDVGDVVAHVGRAGDHLLGAVRHPVLDAVDVALRMLVHPALVAAVLGRVDRDRERRVEALGEVVAGDRDEPVVAVHDVELEPVAELDPGGQHVGVHVLDPGDELGQLRGPLRLQHAVQPHALRRSPRQATPRARASARGRRRPGRRGSPPACARGARGRPRSAAGTPRTGSATRIALSAPRARQTRAPAAAPGSRLGSQPAQALVERGAPVLARRMRPTAVHRAEVCHGAAQRSERLAERERVIADALARDSRPPARAIVMKAQSLDCSASSSRAARRAAAARAVRRSRPERGDELQLRLARRPRRRRRPPASPRCAGPCRCPRSTRRTLRLARLVALERLGQRASARGRGARASSITASSHTGPSYHQCPSSSVSSAQTTRAGSPARGPVCGRRGDHLVDEVRARARAPARAAASRS